MESKIRIKLGPIEVEYEGSETFLKQELPNLIKTLTELSKSAGSLVDQLGGIIDDTGQREMKLSTNSIAAKLSCSSGPDLAVAAAAHLTFVKKQDVFKRQQLLTEMKSASGYYKSSYGANLSGSLKTLVKNQTLTEPSTGNYSLSAKTRKDLGGRLAQ
jgi:hypothetical protein